MCNAARSTCKSDGPLHVIHPAFSAIWSTAAIFEALLVMSLAKSLPKGKKGTSGIAHGELVIRVRMDLGNLVHPSEHLVKLLQKLD